VLWCGDGWSNSNPVRRQIDASPRQAYHTSVWFRGVAMHFNKLSLEPMELQPRIGTQISWSADREPTEEVGREVRALLEQRGVVLIRKADLSDEQQVAFTKMIGPMAQDIFKISMDPLENPQFAYTKGAFFWHIDGTMSDTPIFASIMSCRRKSEEGGQTEFANTYAAWDDLPPSEQQALERLSVVHMFETAQRYVNPEPSWTQLQDWQRFPPVKIPLVWKHRSGRKSLVLGSTAAYVDGMALRESAALLTRLRDHATQPQFTYRHDWTVGDMIVWDNTGTMHRVLAYPAESGRLMHRTTVQGDEPFA
jgi:alpha-ketoglutarate-dependent taurine dioxygenase